MNEWRIGSTYERLPNGRYRVFLWQRGDWSEEWAEGTLAEISADPRLERVPGQRGLVTRLLREEEERKYIWTGMPDVRQYGPGLTYDEALREHCLFLRSGWSRASSGAYHYANVTRAT